MIFTPELENEKNLILWVLLQNVKIESDLDLNLLDFVHRSTEPQEQPQVSRNTFELPIRGCKYFYRVNAPGFSAIREHSFVALKRLHLLVLFMNIPTPCFRWRLCCFQSSGNTCSGVGGGGGGFQSRGVESTAVCLLDRVWKSNITLTTFSAPECFTINWGRKKVCCLFPEYIMGFGLGLLSHSYTLGRKCIIVWKLCVTKYVHSNSISNWLNIFENDSETPSFVPTNQSVKQTCLMPWNAAGILQVSRMCPLSLTSRVMLSSASGAETFKPSADSEEDKNKPVSVRGQTNDHFPGCREHDLHQGHREYRLTFSDAIQERSRNKANTKISREKNKRLLPLHVKGWGGGGCWK